MRKLLQEPPLEGSGVPFTPILGKKPPVRRFHIAINNKIFAHAPSFPGLFISQTRQKYYENRIKNPQLLETCGYFSKTSP